MTLFEMPNMSAGIDDTLVGAAQSVPAFPIGILLFTFFVIVLSGSASQKKRIGSADVPMWAAIAGICTTFMALILTLGSGMIDVTVLGIVIAVTIFCGIWFFLSKVRGES